MVIAIALIVLVVATVLFHFLSPWYFTPIGPEVCTNVEGVALIRSGSTLPKAAAPRAELREVPKSVLR